MKLIQQLNEASELGLEDLKKAMKKDKKVAPIFTKTSTWDSIENKKQFIDSLKFWFFNNKNVKAFVDSRDDVGYIPYTFETLRKTKPQDFSENDFENLKKTVSEVFKDVTRTQNTTLTPETRKQLVDFVNSNNRHHNLSRQHQKELESIPGLRPSEPVLVYRGLLFSKSSLESRETYNGTLEIGNGLKFLKAIRKGTKIVDLEWERPSSWSLSKEVASRFAQYGPASSNFHATLQWLNRDANKKHIDGELGFVVAVRALPEDILVDINKISSKLNMAHGDEQEIILKPGKYTCKIVKKYTVRDGEVEVTAPDDYDKSAEILDSIIKDVLTVHIDLPSGVLEFVKEINKGWYFSDNAFKYLKTDKDSVRLMMVEKTTTALVTEFDQHIKKLANMLSKIKDVNPASVPLDVKSQKTFNLLNALYKSVSGEVVLGTSSKKEKIKIGDMSGEKFRYAQPWSNLLSFEREMLVGGRIISDDAGALVVSLSSALDLPLGVSSRKFKMYGGNKQKEILSSALNKFFKRINVDAPDSDKEQLKLFITLARKYYRNVNLARFLESIKGKLDSIKSADQ